MKKWKPERRDISVPLSALRFAKLYALILR